MEWMNGKTFDFNKVCCTDPSRPSSGYRLRYQAAVRRLAAHVFIHNVREVSRTFDVPAPSFYRRPDVPRHLRLVA
ncbi:hypothetical protein GEV42_16155 [Pseudomonas aeruginosa]|uniref:hypothetical protein n=1 Tax=Pseudomonas aeruginosa TaxID=287 RepID=UPI00156D9510|nr:hypothetical protein [Pseudomonas aeruginosa]QKL13494.1 hypothetical protein GEV42_16155 [Pseudomonas aeruginosa]